MLHHVCPSVCLSVRMEKFGFPLDGFSTSLPPSGFLHSAGYPETSVLNQPTLRNNPEDGRI